MKYDYLHIEAIHQFIATALYEDVREGDHSSLSVIPKDASRKAKVISKDNGILAGTELADHIFRWLDPCCHLTFHKTDGHPIAPGDMILEIEANALAILKGERLMLNCMQRMSGIATYTYKVASIIANTPALLLDTRKTTPNFRMMEKWAVKIGGGHNHRFGLFDLIMLKDNHIDFAGGITPALLRCKEYVERIGKPLSIEIETRNLLEAAEAVDLGIADVIMLDNMDVPTIKKAVELINGRAKTEASGGINEETILDIARTGVDYISMGALTHSARNIDISLKAS